MVRRKLISLAVILAAGKNQPLAAAELRLRVDPENEYNRNRSDQASTDQNGHYVIRDVAPESTR